MPLPLLQAFTAALQQAQDKRNQFGVQLTGDDHMQKPPPAMLPGVPAVNGDAISSDAVIPDWKYPPGSAGNPNRVSPPQDQQQQANVQGWNDQQQGGVQMPSWNFVPRVKKPQPPTPAFPLSNLFTDAIKTFPGQMQDAMDKMWEINRYNQAASLHQRDLANQLEIARLQAQAPIEAAKIRATALAQALGAIGGPLRGGPGGYDSNIGQSIWFQGGRRKRA